MKSAYYTAVVTNAYKMAIDSYFSGEYQYNPEWYRELESVSHREYHSGYYFTDSHSDANVVPNNGYIKDKAYLAVAVSYDAERGLAEFSQRNKMCKGDLAELLTPGNIGREIVIGDIFDENMNPIESTPHPYMSFFMKVDVEVKEGDILRAK